MNDMPVSMPDQEQEIPAACIIDPDGKVIEVVYSSIQYPKKNYKINWEALRNGILKFEGDK